MNRLYHIHYKTPDGKTNRGKRMQTQIKDQFTFSNDTIYLSPELYSTITHNRPVATLYASLVIHGKPYIVKPAQILQTPYKQKGDNNE